MIVSEARTSVRCMSGRTLVVRLANANAPAARWGYASSIVNMQPDEPG